MTAADRWRERLAEWAIPEYILAAADDSPWQAPPAAMIARTEHPPDSPSLDRTAEALDPAGTVLDVGAGAGAASLPVAKKITELTAVDENIEMLATLTALAAPLGLVARTVHGCWPDVAPTVSTVDVVVCHHRVLAQHPHFSTLESHKSTAFSLAVISVASWL